MRRLRVLVGGVAALGACGPVDGGPGLLAPVNSCAASACANYQQRAGVAATCTEGNLCQAKNALDFTIVATIPQSSIFAPGRTFVAKYKSLAHSTVRCPLGSTCAKLQPLCEIAGVYGAYDNAAKLVGFNLGEGLRSVPVHASFRPAWTFGTGDGAAAIDVGLLGMDLQPVIAAPATDEPGYPPPSTGPRDTSSSIGFDSPLPCGTFEETLMPTPPFDRAFPPWVKTLAVTQVGPLPKRDKSEFTDAVFGLPNDPVIVPHPVNVTRAGGLSLDGWTVYLRDDRTRRRISSIASVGQASTVKLFTVGQEQPGASADTIRNNVELVLAPPAEARLPELVLAAIANQVPSVAPYPLVPPLVTVRGFVAADDGTPVAADIVLQSDELTTLDSEVGPRDLRFVDELSTTARGTYERLLPPGKYTAIITPALSSGFAKTIAELVVAVPSAAGQVQEGKKLQVKHAVLLSGTCRATDGRLLADAEVEAHASASLRYAAADKDRDPNRWPRTVRTRTNASGGFVLPVDEGSVFDIVVRPANGTRFPWSVVPQVTAPAQSLELEVPAPLIASLVLHDPGDNPVSHALVQAFVGIPAPTPGAPAVAIELGRARTDDSGRFELFLDGRPK